METHPVHTGMTHGCGLPISWPPGWEGNQADVASRAAQEAKELARTGRTIDALRLYRQRTGAGLAEAKAAIGL